MWHTKSDLKLCIQKESTEIFLQKMQAAKMSKRKGLVEKEKAKSASELLGQNHVELRQKLQKSRQTRTRRSIRAETMPGNNSIEIVLPGGESIDINK